MDTRLQHLCHKCFAITTALICASQLAAARNDWDRDDVETAVRLGVGAVVGIVIAVIFVIVGCCVLICRVCCGACQSNRTVVNYQTVVHRPPPQAAAGPVILNVAPQPSPTGYHSQMVSQPAPTVYHPHMAPPPSHQPPPVRGNGGYVNPNLQPGASAPYESPPPYNPDIGKMY